MIVYVEGPLTDGMLYQPIYNFCSSGRLAEQGPRQGALVCVMKRGRPVNPSGGEKWCFTPDPDRGEFGPLPLEH